MPVDLSYVDENEIVRFYTDTKHRVFPRSKNVIGRDVKNCHPKKSVHIVEEIIEKFRSGEQNEAEFWINKPEVFLYIVYFAVHDDAGNFRGVLEMMQDCTHIRSLTGSQTLLTWANQEPNSPTGNNTGSTPANPEEGADSTEGTAKKPIAITPETQLKDLFTAYPTLKKELAARYTPFKMLNSPLGKLILKKATIASAGERSGLGEEKLIAMIKEIIAQ